MKIVQIGPFPIDLTCIKGGVEASVYGLTKELAGSNEMIVIDIPRFEVKHDTLNIEDNVQIFRFYSGKKNSDAVYRIKEVFLSIRKLEPEICHIHTTSLFSFLLYLQLRLHRIPTIVTVHGLLHIEKQNAWKKRHSFSNLMKYILQSVTEFLFLSICPIVIVDTPYVEDAIKKYKEQHKIFKMPVCKVIPQGIQQVFFELEHNAESKNILSVGAINKRKGQLFLIDSMAKVGIEHPDFKLSIVGIISDESYYESIKNKIIEKGLSKNIEIFPDVPFKEILEFYSKSEIFVLHSEEESQGIVFCEAMAAGNPIVATNVGGVPWVVENKVNGLLSDYGDIDSFANHIITILSDESIRNKMEVSNRIQSLKYEWKIIANEIIDLYKEMIINH